MNIALFQEIAEHFGITSKVESVHEIKAGHINETYHVVFKNNLDLVFQKINTYVFKEAKSVMHNIELVTSFLKKKGLSKRNLLLFLKANDGNYFHIDEKGNFWRVE